MHKLPALARRNILPGDEGVRHADIIAVYSAPAALLGEEAEAADGTGFIDDNIGG